MPDRSYAEFLSAKAQYGSPSGFDPIWLPDSMFDFQQYLTTFGLQQGRGAIWADCGLGKTLIELVWSDNVVRKTNGRILLATPLAVAPQTISEGEKFGVECAISRDGMLPAAKIVVTNYEQLHKFNPDDFVGMVCDESSAIKNFASKRKGIVTEFMRTLPYRLLCTATAAPNDYTEIGTSSEALGELGHIDMLNRFFKNDQNSSDTRTMRRTQSGQKSARWRFKGHAQGPFWRWVCSYARACRKPNDLGFDDLVDISGVVRKMLLPKLIETEYIVEARTLAPGKLFATPAENMQEEREERRRTLKERCEKAISLVDTTGKPAVIFYDLTDEGKKLRKLNPEVTVISGTSTDEQREEAYDAFSTGQLRLLAIQRKIGCFGLNWQHCSHVVTFATHSYEMYYQAVRRCWRFGQKHPVTVDLIATEGERGIKENLRRKSAAADQMFTELVEHMRDSLRLDRNDNFNQRVEIPTWAA